MVRFVGHRTSLAAVERRKKEGSKTRELPLRSPFLEGLRNMSLPWRKGGGNFLLKKLRKEGKRQQDRKA
jgi:hypothetical protein